MNFKVIVAYCKNKGIGYYDKIPWHFSEDFKSFSQKTIGKGNNAIIMGKNTWLSLPKKPLPKRDNLVLSTSLKLDQKSDNFISKSFADPILLHKYCIDRNYDDIWIIGGSEIYSYYIKNFNISEIYITYINKDYDCNVFFPSIPYFIKRQYICTDLSFNLLSLHISPLFYLVFKKLEKGMEVYVEDSGDVYKGVIEDLYRDRLPEIEYKVNIGKRDIIVTSDKMAKLLDYKESRELNFYMNLIYN